MRQARTRTAFAVSTLLHVAVLGALLFSVHPPSLPSPLSVRFLRLSEGAAPAPAGTGASQGLSALRPPARTPSVQRDVKSTAPTATPTVAVAGVSEEATSSATQPLGASLPADDAPKGEHGLAAPMETSGGGGIGAAGGVPTDARLLELHRRLAAAAARCYPTAARRFRLQGEVPLHFCLDAAGTATALRLQGSTGSSLLDRSALECVVPGAQPLSGFEGCFLVPVRFGG
jgi:TonB family protein